jgi:hypothetical protein
VAICRWARDHAVSLTTRVATTVSGVGESTASTNAATSGSNEGQSSRLESYLKCYLDFRVKNVSAAEVSEFRGSLAFGD